MASDVMGKKDSKGQFILQTIAKLDAQEAPKEEYTIPPDASVDDLLRSGFETIRVALIAVRSEVNMRTFDRDTIMNLKDLMSMLKDLKKQETDLLDSMSDEELEELLKRRK